MALGAPRGRLGAMLPGFAGLGFAGYGMAMTRGAALAAHRTTQSQTKLGRPPPKRGKTKGQRERCGFLLAENRNLGYPVFC
jgi:hypothetical protein